MKRVATLAGRETAFFLKRSRRRSVGLRVDANGLTVTIPLAMPEWRLIEILEAKSDWIADKLGSLKPPPAFAEGETLSFLGRTCVLRVSPSPKIRVGIEADTLLVAVPHPEKIRPALEAWYRKMALAHFAERVAHFSPILGVKPSALLLSSAKTRWGSCNSKGEIRLNWHLVRLAPELIDYVVVHELAHLIELNHSPAFWRNVERACPDYRNARRELGRGNAMW